MSRYLRHTKTWTATLRQSAWSLAVVVTCFPAVGAACAQQAVAHPGQSPIAKDNHASQQSARTKRDRLMEIYLSDAAEYTIYRDASRKERVELRREPVYVWTNPVRTGGQDGAVYVWTCRGRPEVFGSVFSFPATGPRMLYHEFHSLSLSVLDVQRAGRHAQTWTPLAPGIQIVPIAGAPAPAPSARERLAQMRTLTRDFSASSRDRKDSRWELRLLPQPLFRYESTDPDVLDGALFTFVTSAGTDPEALLLIEARKPSPNDSPIWHYAIARFTDLQLSVRHKGNEVFTVPLIPDNSPDPDLKDRFRGFHDRDIPPVEDKAP
jgi:hypothetical protein